MTGFSGFFGSSRRHRTAGPGADGPGAGAGPSDGQQPGPVVIHAPRAGEATPVPRPTPSA